MDWRPISKDSRKIWGWQKAWGNDKIEQGLLRDAEFKAAGVPKNALFHFSLIFDLIFQNFKGGGFTVLIFQFIFQFIFDGLCLQKWKKKDQKRIKNGSKMRWKMTEKHPFFKNGQCVCFWCVSIFHSFFVFSFSSCRRAFWHCSFCCCPIWQSSHSVHHPHKRTSKKLR